MLNSLVALYDSGAGGGAAGDFEPIATVTVGSGGASSIEFSSIPSTYAHLQVRGIMRKTSSGIADIYTTFNNDGGGNYSRHYLLSFDGAGPYVGASTSASYFSVGYAYGDDANVYGGIVLDILDYANTNKYKTVRSLGGNEKSSTGTSTLTFNSASWRSTGAINRITFTVSDFSQYSTFALYGIKA